jgi:excisionase family DNA binding protein
MASMRIRTCRFFFVASTSKGEDEMKRNETTEHTRLSTIRDVAEKCQVSTRTVHNWKDSGLLPFIKISNQIRFRPEDVQAFIDSYAIFPHRDEHAHI